MNSKVTFLLSLSCGLPLLVYLFRGKRVDKRFHPLIMVFAIALCAELTIRMNELYFKNKDVNYHTYTVACIGYLFFYCRFYYAVHIIKKKPYINLIMLFFVLACLTNWILLYEQERFFNFFRISLLYAVIILFFSVELLSKQLFKPAKSPLKNPQLLIGIAGVIFHTFFIFLVSLILLKTKDGNFINQVFDIQKFINVLSYVIISIAFLCIPKTGSYIK